MIEELPLIPIETKETHSPEETESLGAYGGETYPDTQVIALLRNAGVFLVMAPLLFFYAVTQRFFVESIERSGLVG